MHQNLLNSMERTRSCNVTTQNAHEMAKSRAGQSKELARSDGWISAFQGRGPRFESPGPPTQGIFLASYLLSMVSRVLWHPKISRGARKLARTPSLSKKKKRAGHLQSLNIKS